MMSYLIHLFIYFRVHVKGIEHQEEMALTVLRVTTPPGGDRQLLKCQLKLM